MGEPYDDYEEEFDPSTVDFSDIEERFKVELPSGFETVVVVDNVPVVGEAKREKLLAVIKRVFKNLSIKDNGLHMPMDSKTGESKGYVFIDFETAEHAALAIKQGNGHKLDKNHVLAVNHFDDIGRYTSMNDAYEEPVEQPFVEKEHLKSWLTDPRARDQWVMMKGDDVSIYWNNKGDAPDLDHSREHWSDMYVSWSPKGTYLATFHKQGIVLWGGPTWGRINKFEHHNVKLIDFSPNEKYVTTWSHEPFITPEGESHHLAIWDITTGLKLRTFPIEAPAASGAQGTVKFDWPIFKWSFDDKYVARQAPGMIQVYETPGMGLLDRKSIKVEDVKTFAWSPSDHLISYWTPESGNIPARVTLLKIPSREVLRTKNLFNVIDCKLFWQPAGDYLLVSVERIKTKKSTMTNFEIFRLREKDVPVDVMELDAGLEVVNIFWEPVGARFGLIAQEGTAGVCHLYQMVSANAAPAAVSVKLLKAFEAKGINQIIWSPKGRFAVLAGVRAFAGELQFWDVDELVCMNTGEHYMCTDVEWDPTGRYVVSSVSWWRVQSDTGFISWSFTGAQITKQTVPYFKQFLWRPRPPTLLSDEQQKKIKKNLKEYSKVFDEEDAAQSKAVSREVLERRIKLWTEWSEYRERVQKDYDAAHEARVQLCAYDPDAKDEGQSESVEEWVEDVIEETEEILAR
ncbi:eukaryotic translation initiation factor eIF2A-domain-containing protein [Fimicolochytrium jonesii]|uniref:eukaryotic translation initiation factor eIF2A-domain-containing protein n=1 Tax=Fimicolochytrium jonesii TaxID=1396493 RepID=UPI0022FDEC25|nr:eukaryotic translation initiation factor eIF2A-domain-containing protein [Fimicolochytrium jonesii]KAI8818548.1 eukaryotic translation initiation factor eIF2A-domain-containing protein [Fimicolochytrium jonesii]